MNSPWDTISLRGKGYAQAKNRNFVKERILTFVGPLRRIFEKWWLILSIAYFGEFSQRMVEIFESRDNLTGKFRLFVILGPVRDLYPCLNNFFSKLILTIDTYCMAKLMGVFTNQIIHRTYAHHWHLKARKKFPNMFTFCSNN